VHIQKSEIVPLKEKRKINKEKKSKGTHHWMIEGHGFGAPGSVSRLALNLIPVSTELV